MVDVDRMKEDARLAYRGGVRPARKEFDGVVRGVVSRCALGAALGGYAAVGDRNYLIAAAKKYGGSYLYWEGFYHGFDGAGGPSYVAEEWKEGYEAGAAFWEEVNAGA